MKRFLTVDWDYFIAASSLQRTSLFPDGGNENIDNKIQQLAWGYRYLTPELSAIGILQSDFALMQDILRKNFPHPVENSVENSMWNIFFPVNISHKEMYDYVKQIIPDKDEEFEVYNVDFHHDLYSYHTAEEPVNCGNWATCLKSEYPNMKYFWVKREDSQEDTYFPEYLDGVLDLTDLYDLGFDYLYLCRSDCWSPPHLDEYFNKLWESVNCGKSLIIEEAAITARTIPEVTPPSEFYRCYFESSDFQG